MQNLKFLGQSIQKLEHEQIFLTFDPCDLDLDPMILKLDLDLDFGKMYHHAKNKLSRSRHSKIIIKVKVNLYFRVL